MMASMITEEDVLSALARVPGPDGEMPLPQSCAIAGVTTVGGKVYLSISIDPGKSMATEPMRRTAETVAKGLPWVFGDRRAKRGQLHPVVRDVL